MRAPVVLLALVCAACIYDVSRPRPGSWKDTSLDHPSLDRPSLDRPGPRREAKATDLPKLDRPGERPSPRSDIPSNCKGCRLENICVTTPDIKNCGINGSPCVDCSKYAGAKGCDQFGSCICGDGGGGLCK